MDPEWHLSGLQSLMKTWKCIWKLQKASKRWFECHPEILLLICTSTSDLTSVHRSDAPAATDQWCSAVRFSLNTQACALSHVLKSVMRAHTGTHPSPSLCRHHQSHQQHTVVVWRLKKESRGRSSDSSTHLTNHCVNGLCCLIVTKDAGSSCSKQSVWKAGTSLWSCLWSSLCDGSHVHQLPSSSRTDLSPDPRAACGEERSC